MPGVGGRMILGFATLFSSRSSACYSELNWLSEVWGVGTLVERFS